jgi:hypothetical protein
VQTENTPSDIHKTNRQHAFQSPTFRKFKPGTDYMKQVRYIFLDASTVDIYSSSLH